MDSAGRRPETCQNPSLLASRPGSRGLHRRCEGHGCKADLRPASANASTEDFISPSASIMSLAGSSCLNWRAPSDRPGMTDRPGTAGSFSLRSMRSTSGKSMASAMSRRQSRRQSCIALSFDQIFSQSFSRAAKRMACERKEGVRPGTALRDRKQYRSLHCWWTMAELKVAEEAGVSDGNQSDGNSSSFGDDQSGKVVAVRSGAQGLQARRMSVEAILEKRRTSFNKAAKAVAVAAAVTAVEALVALVIPQLAFGPCF
ncbi:unnamed protein product, partial [Durusdinium trenchii]